MSSPAVHLESLNNSQRKAAGYGETVPDAPLRAGPLLAPLGALVADGTAVTFTLTGPGGQAGHSRTRTAVTQYGFAEALVYIGDLPPGSYQVTAVAEQAGAAQAATTFSLPEARP